MTTLLDDTQAGVQNGEIVGLLVVTLHKDSGGDGRAVFTRAQAKEMALLTAQMHQNVLQRTLCDS